MAIDSFHTRLNPTNLRDGQEKAEQWPAACVRILQDLRAAMPGKLVWFNGIWAWDQALIDAQAALLEYAHGASVEFYGYDDMGTITTRTFERIVQPINAMLEAHPDKPILVRGTSLHHTFYDYVTDLRNARYCYGCYLLAKTPGSFFNYGQNFQIARMPRERTGGSALHSYLELPLGQPTGRAVANGTGGWSRMYEGGQVFVAPAEGERQQFQVGFDSWSTTGEWQPWGSVLLVLPADAVILLREPPPPPPRSLEANIADSSTDWLVQCETGEYRYNYLTVSVSSRDLHSAVLVRFETDDDPRPFGILEILPQAGTFDPGRLDYPYGYTTTLGAAHATNSVRYPTNGTWIDLTIPLQTECAPYPCFRVISVKAIGAVNVRTDPPDRARGDTTMTPASARRLSELTRELAQPVLHDDELRPRVQLGAFLNIRKRPSGATSYSRPRLPSRMANRPSKSFTGEPAFHVEPEALTGTAIIAPPGAMKKSSRPLRAQTRKRPTVSRNLPQAALDIGERPHVHVDLARMGRAFSLVREPASVG